MKISFISTMEGSPTMVESIYKEMIFANIVDELDYMGHEVTLYASPGSTKPTNGHLIEMVSRDSKNVVNPGVEHNNIIMKANDILAGDIIHDASSFKYAHYYASIAKQEQKALAMLADNDWAKLNQPQHVVLLSKSQMDLCIVAGSPFFIEPHPHPIYYPMNSFINVINPLYLYPDVDLDIYKSNYEKEDYAVWFGKLVPESGLLKVIELCKKTKTKLKISGYMNSQEETDYYNKIISPLLDGTLLKYQDIKNEDEFIDVVGKAKVMLYTPNIQDPFGLHQMQAMALGTPSIVNSMGGLPETIEHETSGFVVPNSLESLEGGLSRLNELSYEKVRRSAERFKKGTAANQYLSLYKKMLNGEWPTIILPFVVR